ncbi:hypothetical protein AB0N24_22860 [Arthrobacter sp. NPDC093128]|uniref:hypothetical protein n=1 Tax=Arthrobacter sp. NPDC093128 TaxID=3154979 RepID=UPI003441F8CD
MEKKKSRRPSEGFVPQDWTGLLAGQHVWVRPNDGATFAAVIETKTSNSSAVWILRDDSLQTRQVFGHTEGIHLVPIEQAADPADQASEGPWKEPRQ